MGGSVSCERLSWRHCPGCCTHLTAALRDASSAGWGPGEAQWPSSAARGVTFGKQLSRFQLGCLCWGEGHIDCWGLQEMGGCGTESVHPC